MAKNSKPTPPPKPDPDKVLKQIQEGQKPKPQRRGAAID